MKMYQEPTPVENPLEDPDSPMEDAPPLEPEPVTHYEPDVPGGHTKTLSSKESPIEPWEAYLTQPNSPVSRKHSLSPTSPSSALLRLQRALIVQLALSGELVASTLKE